MPTDIEIARAAALRPVVRVAKSIGIQPRELFAYGPYMTKVQPSRARRHGSKLILVTAVHPTKLGEGKTTVSIGLADALHRLGDRTALALREPSLGPVFGIKGGAAGGGRAQVAPMDAINLHFTGDLHAITAANNLLSAMIDNHLHWGNALKLHTIVWKRCLDCNDRALRNVVVGGDTAAVPAGLSTEAGLAQALLDVVKSARQYGALKGDDGAVTKNGPVRPDGFNITAASEIMAIFCLASDFGDLKARLARIVVGYTADDTPVTAGDLGAAEAMAILLQQAFLPNLVQTLEGTPAFVHGGPFANIAHGCNSLVATRTALAHADYVVTEAGFGADLGAEKFFDIKCRAGGLKPSAVVLVATVRALKLAAGTDERLLSANNPSAVERGLPGLMRHLKTLREVYGMPVVVAVNRFLSDSDDELAVITRAAKTLGAEVVPTTVWTDGGAGGVALAEAVKRAASGNAKLYFAYTAKAGLVKKMTKIVKSVYGGSKLVLSEKAQAEAARLERLGYGSLPVCMAKTQYSFTADPKVLGAPAGFTVTVEDLELRAGAGFIVARCGSVMLMPGLPAVPNACKMTIDAETLEVAGLF
ncbi:MAG: formate--tetrahydrofolate ligase [Clostridiales bacterium]|nr:formate--tetrahydrofolate ligase [Clostridiales bacterium]